MNNKLVVMITSFLGKPLTSQSALEDQQIRFNATFTALNSICNNLRNKFRLIVAFTGAYEQACLMAEALGLLRENWMWFEQNVDLIEFGKGRLEHELILKSIRHWGADVQNACVLKITGKYIVENLDDVIDYLVDLNSPVCAWKHLNKPIVDTRVFGFKPRSYIEASDILDNIDDRKNYYMEHAVNDWVARSSGVSNLLFKRPLISGLSGSSDLISRPNIFKRLGVKFVSRFTSLNLISGTKRIAGQKKIFLVINSLKVCGGVLEAYKLATELHELGEQVSIVTMWRSPNEIALDSGVPVLRLTNWRTRMSLAMFQIPVMSIMFWLLSYIINRSAECNTWIFTHYTTLPLSLSIKRRKRWIYVQGEEWNFLKIPGLSFYFRELIFFFYRRSYLLVTNNFLKQSLTAHRIDVAGMAPIWAAPEYLRDEKKNKIRDIDVVIMLRKGQLKRLDLYKDCLRFFAEKQPQLKIGIITPEREYVDFIRGYTSAYLLCPTQKEMADLYERAKIFLLLSDFEGFGLPPLEAMGAGCIPICRNSGGPVSYMVGDLEKFILPLTIGFEDICKEVINLLRNASELQDLSILSRQIYQDGLANSEKRNLTVRNLLLAKNN